MHLWNVPQVQGLLEQWFREEAAITIKADLYTAALKDRS